MSLKTVCSIRLETTEEQKIKLPINSTILSLHRYVEIGKMIPKPILFYHADVGEERFNERTITACSTDCPAPKLENYDYLGSVVVQDGSAVHFFISK